MGINWMEEQDIVYDGWFRSNWRFRRRRWNKSDRHLDILNYVPSTKSYLDDFFVDVIFPNQC